jgi:hypothetical protein
MTTVSTQADEAHSIPALAAPLALPQLPELSAQHDTASPLRPNPWIVRCLIIVVSPGLSLIEFFRAVFSPGLKDVPTLPCTRISNGGHHRY